MCGIAGIVSTRLQSPDDLDRRLRRMLVVLRHRGPDGEGTFVAPGVALGHRRLSIVDLAGGGQPMTNAEGTGTITYNGEVFNHVAVRAELEATGARFQSRCDTEVVLQAIAREGTAGVRRLRGMFAFGVWEPARRRLVLGRDRFGVKPLYYAIDREGTLVFASEIKSILASGLQHPSMRVAGLPEFLAHHAMYGSRTMFEGIHSLLPGHVLVWQDGRVELERYYQLPWNAHPHGLSLASAAAEYRDRLALSVRLRLMADVPVGVFLSGGLDSAAIASLMAAEHRERLHAFSIGYAERESDELTDAEATARAIGCEFHGIRIDAMSFLRLLPRLVWHEDEPIAHPSSVSLYAVAEAARERVKVVLTGEGSDETLGGYNRYRFFLINRRLATLAPAPAFALARSVSERVGGRAGQLFARSFVGRGSGLRALYLDNFSAFTSSSIAALLTPMAEHHLEDPHGFVEQAILGSPAPTMLGRLLDADLGTYLHELLMKQDRMSMAASIESRVPFLDHPLVEWACNLPDRHKIHRTVTKVVLREAMRGTVPAAVLTRRKRGFPVPLAAWLRGPLRASTEQLLLGPRAATRAQLAHDEVKRLLLEHLHGGHDHSARLFLLLGLELWQRLFLDGEPIEAVERGFVAANGE